MMEDWVKCEFSDLLNYEQPTKYIVSSTNYNDSYETPVLTAGKSFIKGYTNEKDGIFDNIPVIIFDDFTTASKYVNFKFKVKSSAMKILLPTSKLVNMKFVFYAMQVNRIRSDTHKRYWISVFSKKNFLIPPLPIQRAIVSKIETLFSSLDQGIADLKNAQAQLKIYRQAVLKKAFEGELTKEWREQQTDLPSADELLEQIRAERQKHHGKQVLDWEVKVEEWEVNGKKEKKPGKPKSLKAIEFDRTTSENYPGNWSIIRSEYISDFITKGTTPQKTELTQDEGDIPFLKVYNLTFTGKLDFTINPTFVNLETHNNFLKRSIVYPNDILMNIVGPPLGKVSIVPTNYSEWNINQAIVRFRPFTFISTKYLSNFLIAEKTINTISKKAKATAGQFNLTLQICREITIPVPSVEEQHQIVQQIESRLSVCDKLEESIQTSLKKAEALRQSILKKAFEGKLLSTEEIEQCKAVPDYEPASVLLERIKQEKFLNLKK